jgi:hypothetical protein
LFWASLHVVFELLATAFQADERANEWQVQLESIDQDALAISAIVLGLAPLLHWQLTQKNLALEPRAMAKLAATREMARTQRSAMDAQLDEILTALERANITPILLKGNHLAASIYPAPELRQMNDIDLLVRPADLAATENALLALGYIANHKSPQRGARVTKHTSTFRPPRRDDPTPNPYLSSAAGRTVEPHTSLEESWYGLRADITPGVWERSVPFAVNAHRARVLSADDLLTHLAVHLTFHLIMGYPAMVQLVDLLFVTTRLQNQIRWDSLTARAVERCSAPFVYAALRLAVKTLGAPIPEAALQDLARVCSARVRAYAETITIANVAARTQRAPVTTFPQRLQRGWQERVEAARWAASPVDQWRIWRTMLDVANTDTGELVTRRVRGAFAHQK